MRVFVTGGTGYIGSGVVRAFLEAGHLVEGLCRSEQSAETLRERGAVPVLGQLADPETYQHFAARADAVVHCAFDSPETEFVAVQALVSALLAEGVNESRAQRSFIYTSGVWVLGDTPQSADEGARTNAPPFVTWRPPLERWILEHASEQLACAVLRPGMVWGGRRGLFQGLIAEAAEGRVHLVGEGQNHIPPVHRDDLARLYLLIAEKKARGIFHGVDGSAPTLEEAAGALGEAFGGVKVHSLSVDEARESLGAFADALALDQRVEARRARELGWSPRLGPFLAHAALAVSEARP